MTRPIDHRESNALISVTASLFVLLVMISIGCVEEQASPTVVTPGPASATRVPNPTGTSVPNPTRTSSPTGTATWLPSPTPIPPCASSSLSQGEIIFLSARNDTDGDGQVGWADEFEYFAVHPEGDELRRLDSLPAAADRSLSPDGQWRVERTPHSFAVQQVEGAIRYEIALPIDYFGSWDWSPDGQELAVGGTREEEEGRVLLIYRVRRDGRSAEALLEIPFATGDWHNTRVYIGGMHWTSDGGRIFFTSPHRLLAETPYFNSAEDISPTEIYVIDLASGTLSRFDEPRFVVDLNWSPDEETILYAQWEGGDMRWVLWLIETDGTDPRPLGEGSFYLEPTWYGGGFSPDSCWIVFTSSWHPIARQSLRSVEIFVVRVDGSGLRQLTDDEYPDIAPRWIP